jgi:DNA-binding MarR family transcriptional regulator
MTIVAGMAKDLDRTLEEIGSTCFCLQSRMTARAVTRRYNAVLAPLGLEVTEFSLLGAIAYGRARSIAEIAERLAFERTTLVRNLKRMAERGLIAQADGGGRAVRYVLTKAGETALRQALPLWRKAQKVVERRLAAHDAGRVLASLAGLRSAAR